MVRTYLVDAKDWVVNQVGTTAGNIRDSTQQTADIARGADDEFNNISRRQMIESTGALLLGYEGAKKVPGAVGAGVEAFPYDVDLNLDIEKKAADPDADPTVTENPNVTEDSVGGGENSGSVGTPGADEEGDTNWVEEYSVAEFSEDLHTQSDYSIVATDDFLAAAYDGPEGGIFESEISESILEVNGDTRAHLYNDDPGLGYRTGFGSKLKVLDDEGELTEILDGYVEEEIL